MKVKKVFNENRYEKVTYLISICYVVVKILYFNSFIIINNIKIILNIV